MEWYLMLGLQTVFLVVLLNVVPAHGFTNGTGTICKQGYGYPYSCPDPEFPRCCRYYYTPSCCEQRAKKICVKTKHGKYDTKSDPPASHAAVWCPKPGQSDDHTVCSYNGNKIDCMSTKTLAAILGGVFGGLILIGIGITVMCCYMVKSGRWVCVKIRPGKWTVMGKEKAARFRQARSGVVLSNNQQIVPGAYPQGAYPQGAYPQGAYPPPAYSPAQPPPSTAPPSYQTVGSGGNSSTQTQYWNPAAPQSTHKY